LSLETTVGERAAAQLTTPGAAKWYRSAGPLAVSHTQLRVERGATLEYLPREAIVFDGARVESELSIDLAADARLAAWDVWCLGRLHAGERFTSGAVTTRLQVTVDGREVLYERAQVEGSGPLRGSAAGLGGAPVFGTLLMVGAEPAAEDLRQCRALPVRGGLGGLTLLPHVLCARYRGQSTEAAHAWFESLWTVLRPVMLGRVAVAPRIWAV
jgi:urease accessory protein